MAITPQVNVTAASPFVGNGGRYSPAQNYELRWPSSIIPRSHSVPAVALGGFRLTQKYYYWRARAGHPGTPASGPPTGTSGHSDGNQHMGLPSDLKPNNGVYDVDFCRPLPHKAGGMKALRARSRAAPFADWTPLRSERRLPAIKPCRPALGPDAELTTTSFP